MNGPRAVLRLVLVVTGKKGVSADLFDTPERATCGACLKSERVDHSRDSQHSNYNA